MARDISTPEVVVDLSGETLTLTKSLGAAIGINAAFGGIFLAGQRAQAGDLAAIATIFRYGAGLDAKAEKEMLGKVFKAGTVACSTKAMNFIGLLMDGEEAEPGEAKPSDQSEA